MTGPALSSSADEERLARMEGARTAPVTVVVPTRDRPRELERCLAALGRQTLADVEIVVVDDRSEDPAAVERALSASDRARLVRGDGRGPAAARNAGVREARGAIVCFTDDDCEPEPRWTELLAAAAGTGSPAAGRTLNGLPESALAVASQAIVEQLQLGSRQPSGRLGFAPTSNLACPAKLARELRFDESYPFAAGEDRDWSARAVGRGLAPRYIPEAVVLHRHRLSLAGFWRQHLAYGRGAARFRRGEFGPRRLLGARARLTLLRDGFRAGPLVGALVCVSQLATAAGYALELARGSARA